MISRLPWFCIFLFTLPSGFAADAPSNYRWVETPGVQTELLAGDRPVVRYVFEPMDDSSPERRELTHKPFHHVYDRAGKSFITKGPGGKFPHHRGIYFGFSKCGFVNAAGEKENVDTWHSRKAYTVHTGFLEQSAGADGGSHKMTIEWRSDASGTFLTETRHLVFRERGDDLVVDFVSTLATDLPAVTLDGDPQHAGFQFRASNEVSESTKGQTYYIRPGSGPGKPGQTINWSAKDDTPATRDLPWKGMSFVAGGERYTVAYLDLPSNPKPARYSERDYGRFGGYFEATVTPDRPLTVRYRLVIRAGEMTAADIEGLSAAFVGES